MNYIKTILASLVLVLCVANTASAYVPIRVSIKFILSPTGTRPATGRLNTDDEINAEVDAANAILAENMSEYRIEVIDFEDLQFVSQWYSTSAGKPDGGTNRDDLRSTAMALPSLYLWRDNAINIYINGGTSSAVSAFPPDNNIILMNQGCGNTPSCILHELGHSLNLLHTHETAGSDDGDECSDTILDIDGWSRDMLATANYGCLYATCTASQQAALDLAYNNIMSYHTDEPQRRLSTCQKDRVSIQGDSDRGWLLAKQPCYVRNSYSGTELGLYEYPFSNLNNALVLGGLANKVLVIEGGTYAPAPFVINTNTEVVTRTRTTTVNPPGRELYPLPTELEKSETPEVRESVKATQQEDNLERETERQIKRNLKEVKTDEEKSAIRSVGEKKKRQHKDNMLKFLKDAEKHAKGDEKVALQFELAQRYKFSGQYEMALQYYTLAAEGAPDDRLKANILISVREMREKLVEVQQPQEQPPVEAEPKPKQP